ncbi:hypothetical protein TPA0907_61430 [Micromonospora humidisoli]|nr:hypothetical protein TPA0907_61430 [Micromonospora sp. AKA109]
MVRPVVSSGRGRYGAGHAIGGGKSPCQTGPHARRGQDFDQIGAHGNYLILPERVGTRP